MVFGRDKTTLEPFAVKEVELCPLGALLFEAETRVLSALPIHRNLPRFYGATVDAENSCGYIVLEYLPFPTLEEHIKTNGALSSADALLIAKQLVDALGTLLAAGFAHRDVKSANILINPNTLCIKLIDFGLSTPVRGEDDRDDVHLGTPLYMAPAVLRAHGYLKPVASDLWSVGIVLWEMLLGAHPFAAFNRRSLLSAAVEIEPNFSGFPAAVRALLRGLLCVDENKRMKLNTATKYLSKLAPTPPNSPRSPRMFRRTLSAEDPQRREQA